mmetsp:Transcript_22120/g.28653  ORF Transcript_22120/g.28653 Transcript_22120/m.28653 type:complete len:192 (-) Transcript_22120:75-650(-)
MFFDESEIRALLLELSRAVYSVQVDIFLWVIASLISITLCFLNAWSLFTLTELMDDHMNEWDAAKKLNRILKWEVYFHGALFCMSFITLDIMLACMSAGGFLGALHLMRRGQLYYTVEGLQVRHHHTMTWRLMIFKIVVFGIFLFYCIMRIYIIILIHYSEQIEHYVRDIVHAISEKIHPLQKVFKKLGNA